MASVNRVIIVGNLGRDPEIRYMPSGEAVCNFSVATTDEWKGKDGSKQSKTEWHNIIIYRKLAEIAGEYLKKGSQVYLEGKIETKKWNDKEGNERSTVQIVCDEMKMLGNSSKPEPKNADTNSNNARYSNEEMNDNIPF